MFKKLMIIGLLSISVLGLLGADAKAYTYKGYGGCFGCGSYEGVWTLAGGGGQNHSIFLVGVFTLQTGALVCGNPGTNQQDVRSGVGGTTPIAVVNPESDLQVLQNGKFLLAQNVPTTVAEFGSLQAFQEAYDVSNLDCRNPNWAPIAYLWGNHTAEGTVFGDCTDPENPNSDTCGIVQDNVKYSCTTNVSFKNYSKGPVQFSCTCVENCDQGIK